MSGKAKESDKLAILDELSEKLSIVKDKDYEMKSTPIPSGSLTLDLALGIGGLPRGAIIDVFGDPSAGKSLISIMAMAQAQKLDGTCVVWDTERSYSRNLNWMRVNGINTSKLRFIKLKPIEGCEKGFDIIETILSRNAADFLVIDSVPGLIPQGALDKDIADQQTVAARANLLARVIPRMTNLADDSKCCVMFINQMRANLGGGQWAPKEKETSDRSLKFFSSIRMDVSQVSKSRKIENDIPVGHRVHVDIVKNKCAAPYRSAEFELNYTSGVDNASEVADILIGAGKIETKGAWFIYGDKKFQGMEKLIAYFRAPDIYASSVEEIKSLPNINAFGVRKITGETKNENPEELRISSEE